PRLRSDRDLHQVWRVDPRDEADGGRLDGSLFGVEFKVDATIPGRNYRERRAGRIDNIQYFQGFRVVAHPEFCRSQVRAIREANGNFKGASVGSLNGSRYQYVERSPGGKGSFGRQRGRRHESVGDMAGRAGL